MNRSTVVEPLASHPQALPRLRDWLEREWPAWYGEGGRGSAEEDLRAFSATGGLPFGVVALRAGHLCGIAVLKAESIPSHSHLCPWASSGLVEPSLRGRGIGSMLLGALEHEAEVRGFDSIHCATASAESLLWRRGWSLLERTTHDGQNLGIYRRLL